MPTAAHFLPGTEGSTWITVAMSAAAVILPVAIGLVLRRRDRAGKDSDPRPVRGWEGPVVTVLVAVVVLILLR